MDFFLHSLRTINKLRVEGAQGVLGSRLGLIFSPSEG